ncbi:MAG: hypothetical protein ACON4Z_17050 [Planctomycetota bacterium]
MFALLDPWRFVPLAFVVTAFAVVWILLGRSRYRVQVLRGRYLMVWHPLDRDEAAAIAARLRELGWLAFANEEPPIDGPVTLLPQRVGELRPFVAVRERDAPEVRALLERHRGAPPRQEVALERRPHRGFTTWPFRWGHLFARLYFRLATIGMVLLILALTILRPLFG